MPVSRIFFLLITFAAPIALMAQGPVCSEPTIRDAVQNHTYKSSDDEFFWSGHFEKPLIGKDEREKATKKSEVENWQTLRSGWSVSPRLEDDGRRVQSRGNHAQADRKYHSIELIPSSRKKPPE